MTEGRVCTLYVGVNKCRNGPDEGRVCTLWGHHDPGKAGGDSERDDVVIIGPPYLYSHF